MVDLEFEKNDPPYPSINILTFDYNKLKLEDDMKITYDEKPCKIYLKTVCATVIKGYQYLLANNVNWFFRYSVENICKSDESY